MTEGSKLTNLELYQEDNKYYLRAEYEIITKTCKKKLTIPKIYLPTNMLYPNIEFAVPSLTSSNTTVDLGFGRMKMIQDTDGSVFITKIIEEYPQKMTLEEIEKKLGYKIELVSKKERFYG